MTPAARSRSARSRSWSWTSAGSDRPARPPMKTPGGRADPGPPGRAVRGSSGDAPGSGRRTTQDTRLDLERSEGVYGQSMGQEVDLRPEGGSLGHRGSGVETDALRDEPDPPRH